MAVAIYYMYRYFWRPTRTRDESSTAILLNGETSGGKACVYNGILSVTRMRKQIHPPGWIGNSERFEIMRSSTSMCDNCFCADNQRELGDRCWENINCYRYTARYYYSPDIWWNLSCANEWKGAYNEKRAFLLYIETMNIMWLRSRILIWKLR